MRTAAAVALALLLLGGEAQAYSDFAELLFGQQSQFAPRVFDQHIEDEATGDEFKCRLDLLTSGHGGAAPGCRALTQ